MDYLAHLYLIKMEFIDEKKLFEGKIVLDKKNKKFRISLTLNIYYGC